MEKGVGKKKKKNLSSLKILPALGRPRGQVWLTLVEHFFLEASAQAFHCMLLHSCLLHHWHHLLNCAHSSWVKSVQFKKKKIIINLGSTSDFFLSVCRCWMLLLLPPTSQFRVGTLISLASCCCLTLGSIFFLHYHCHTSFVPNTDFSESHEKEKTLNGCRNHSPAANGCEWPQWPRHLQASPGLMVLELWDWGWHLTSLLQMYSSKCTTNTELILQKVSNSNLL